jgi:hypothetical protein
MRITLLVRGLFPRSPTPAKLHRYSRARVKIPRLRGEATGGGAGADTRLAIDRAPVRVHVRTLTKSCEAVAASVSPTRLGHLTDQRACLFKASGSDALRTVPLTTYAVRVDATFAPKNPGAPICQGVPPRRGSPRDRQRP